MKNWLLSGLLFLIVTTVFSQGKITGTITDGQGSLPGANVAIKGTTIGATTDFDGKFSINATTNSGVIVITYLGYETKTISFTVSGTQDLGAIALTSNSNELEEVVVKSTVIDIAKERKTPVAVSTIRAAEIQEKLGSQEFPEILKNTPSVYATKAGGGFGDSRINIRGFDQRNIAVMINGVPVNDMENGAVFWSNWAGLSDVTTFMQVQRGLGSSKLAIASVGGTINVVTKTTDKKQGGTVGTSIGNSGYLKSQASYSTGLLANGLSMSVLFSQTQGDGYIDGTGFKGNNYFIGVGYASKNKKHDFQLTVTGAPQWHNQRSAAPTLATYLLYGKDGAPNTRYNSDWGYLDGQEFSMRRNFYHKPIASINWDWRINETTKISTVLYASKGRGAGSNGTGGIRGSNYLSSNFRTATGLVDFDKIAAYNAGTPVYIAGVLRTRTKVGGQFENGSTSGSSTTSTSGISRINSVNSHDWYGAVIGLNKKLGEHLTLDFGLDARTYKGLHYQNVNSLLGGQVFKDNTDVNNPNRFLTGTYPASPSWNPFYNTNLEEKITFNNDGLVRWYGAFTQLEYSTEKLTAFIQGSVSQQGFKRVDYFKYLASNPLSETDYENLLGGNIKGGLNYNINEHHNVFVNSGYYSKQPFFNAVYPNNGSVVGKNLVNETIIGFEAGYGFKSRNFTANLNAYQTTWKDRYQRQTDIAADNPGGYYDFTGINEVHEGVEFEASLNVTEKFKLRGSASVGDWKYNGNSVSNRFDAQNEPFAGGTIRTLYLQDVKVGDAAQTTASFGASYQVSGRAKIDANFNYYDKLYALIFPNNFDSPTNKGSLELPSYNLVDAGFTYKLPVGKNDSNSINFRLNVNNLFDTVYIAESRDNIFADDNVSSTNPLLGTYASNNRLYKGVADANRVFFGYGRTWNFSLNYKF